MSKEGPHRELVPEEVPDGNVDDEANNDKDTCNSSRRNNGKEN
jgi:hypothetical protein